MDMESDPGWKYLRRSREQIMEDQSRPYDSKKNCWIPHPEEGYLQAEIVSGKADKITVKIAGGNEKIVKQEEIQEMNPPKFEKTEDMSNLTFLNDASVLHNLRARYGAMLIYTYSGLFCVVINPYKRLPIYTDSVARIYIGKRRTEMPPHLFAVSDEAYRNMLQNHENQSMLITGESGAGKTENTKKVICYFAEVGASQQQESGGGKSGPTLEDQIVQTNPVLEAFGNAKTVRNNNSSRFGKFIRIHFNKQGKLASCDIEHYLLEKSRVIRQAPGERCYHIFYQIQSGFLPDLKKQLLFDLPTKDYYFIAQAELTIDGVNDLEEHQLTHEAFKVLNFTESEIQDVYRLVSGIMHMGNMKFKQRPREEQAEADGTGGKFPFALGSLLLCFSPWLLTRFFRSRPSALCVPLAALRRPFSTRILSPVCLVVVRQLLLLLLIPSDAAHSLIPSLITIFVLFTFFPFPPLAIFFASVTISLAQLSAFAMSAEVKPNAEKLVAALLAHLWTHLVGFYSMANGRKISRAVFLSARNSVESETEWQKERVRMAQLLSASLPPHVVASVLVQLDGPEVPRVFVEHFVHASVLFARFHGLSSVLAQLQVPDSARLLNELDNRISRLAKLHGLLRVQSDAVLALSGVPKSYDGHALAACRFAFDLLALAKSLNDAASVDVDVRVGIGSGSLSGGIVGARRWHWDVIGMAVDAAMHLESNCAPGAVLISDDTWRLVGGRMTAERVDKGCWRVSPPEASPPNPSLRPLLFPSASRRFSLLTTPQAINRLLNHHQSLRPATTVATTDGLPLPTPFSKRKCQPKKAKLFRRFRPPADACHNSMPPPLLGHHPLRLFSLQFSDDRIEQLFHAQIDRWFIPGLALSVLFLALFGLFQALAMPRLLTTLATLALALALMFLLLLGLYVSCCESFCQFVTRTSFGRSITVLLVLALLSICGIANSVSVPLPLGSSPARPFQFSCPSLSPPAPSSTSPSSASSSVCFPVHFPSLSFSLWMLHSAVFPRFPSALLLPLLLSSVGLLSVHLFLSHPSLYTLSAPLLRFELLLGLLTLALLLFLNSRRNEILLRMDFLAVLRSMEDNQRLQRTEFLNDQILLNALPAHIALNYAARTEPFVHLCPSVGILCARLGRAGDWVGEFGFDRLNRIVCDLDGRLAQLSEHRLEKVRSAHSTYVVACGILPELARNVHDTPCTIGEQLAVLAEFAQEIEKMADSEGLDIAIGLDCGTALSVVVGWEGPSYELWGQPNTRAKKLMEAATALGGDCVLLSEDVYSALRPRAQFSFDEQSALSVAPGLVAYSLLHPCQSLPNSTDGQKVPPPPPPHRNSGGVSDRNDRERERVFGRSQPPLSPPRPNIAEADLMCDLSPCSSSGALLLPQATEEVRVRSNPLAEMAGMFNSMHSSLSSELFSVDVMSVETDSELEWVTPEMIASREYRPSAISPIYIHPAATQIDTPDIKLENNGNHHQHNQLIPPTGGFIGKKRQLERKAQIQNGPLLPKSWRSSCNTSALGSRLSLAQESPALEKLNSAARRVDRMLKELAGMDGLSAEAGTECVPFPNNDNGAATVVEKGPKMGVYSSNIRREGSGGILSEYDNNSNGFGAAGGDGWTTEEDRRRGGGRMWRGSWEGRLERVRRKLMTNRRRFGRTARADGGGAGGDEADISCSCSSMASSQQNSFMPCTTSSNCQHQKASELPLLAAVSSLRWRQSAHSIGYENEYEMASAPLSSCSSYTGISVEMPDELPPLPSPPSTIAHLGQSVGEFAQFVPIDSEEEMPADEGGVNCEGMAPMAEGTSLKSQMLRLSRDIRENFGDFPLAHFSDDFDFEERKRNV
uniref:Myosin motor domain-containing protein n=1 Tax=Globodera pallida TaxID=36090 RepID=A0A183BNY1_GLOPA